MMPLHARCAPATPPDRTDSQLERCLDDAAHQSTAGQTDCIGTANRAWDQRMNRAYDPLIHTLPAQAAASLRSVRG
ncbi:lysozyme inhibitor LprI family protein [Burkholderia alba]|uniref:lysozyme inhibitor LprI family protein n=1 Tax=Burkholderia alba TaxID=2683677 RepID=UPI002B051E76|nr:lysozyme inhibitor LprI family protein [Burkholderia alba]